MLLKSSVKMVPLIGEGLIGTTEYKRLKKHLQLLEQEQQFKQLRKKTLVISMLTTPKVKGFLLEQPVESILKDEQQRAAFFIQLEKVCEGSGL